MNRHHQKHGVTLIELLVVVLIISALLAFGLTAVSKAKETALLTATNQQMAAVNAGMMAYKKVFGDLLPSNFLDISGSSTTEKVLGLDKSDFIGWKGTEIMVQGLLGPSNDDGKKGYGFINNVRVFGPYFDLKRAEALTLRGEGSIPYKRWTMKTPMTRSDHRLLYFRAVTPDDPTSPTKGLIANFNVDINSSVWSPDNGRFRAKDNEGFFDEAGGAEDWKPTLTYWSDMAVADDKDRRILDFQNALRGANFMLYACGPDDEFGTADDIWTTFR